MKKLSQAAQVAKEIKSKLKANGIKARVKSAYFSMGNSVNVHVTDQPSWVFEAMEEELDCYEYGTFDGMTDTSGVKNRDFAGPQTKYLSLHNDMSDELRLRIWQMIQDQVTGFEGAPADPEDCWNFIHQPSGDYASTWIHKVFNGDELDLWEKPRITATAAPESTPKPVLTLVCDNPTPDLIPALLREGRAAIEEAKAVTKDLESTVGLLPGEFLTKRMQDAIKLLQYSASKQEEAIGSCEILPESAWPDIVRDGTRRLTSLSSRLRENLAVYEKALNRTDLYT